MKKVLIIIPCHNEEKGIAKVLDSLPTKEQFKRHHLRSQVVVIDNNSTDNTRQVALKKGASVVFEGTKGKGNAIKKGFSLVNKNVSFVVMLDGDNTYDGKELFRLIEPLYNDFCDVIVGTRLGGRIRQNSLSYKHRLVNWVFTFLVRKVYLANVTDVLSGYFAWKSEVIIELRDHLESNGFAIEMEMITKMKKLGYSIFSVPITYSIREGESKINALHDGYIILRAFLQNLFWSKPLIDEKKKKRFPILKKLNLFKYEKNY